MLWDVDVWREMERLRREMNGLFSGYDRNTVSAQYPLVNVYESDDRLTLTAELAGATKENVSITYSDGAVTISGTRSRPQNVKDMAALREERTVGKFEKTIRIPMKIDADGISASFMNGILSVTLPKAEEAKPKSITIEAK